MREAKAVRLVAPPGSQPSSGGANCLPAAERIWWRPGDQRRLGLLVSDIFREIDEELRRDNLLKLWSRYGKYVIAIAVLALLIAGGVVAWREHQASERRGQGQRYSNALALVRAGKDGDAAKVFALLAREGGGYSLLAAFEEAELLAKTGDRKGAIAAYDRIAGSPGSDPEFRDLAVLLSATQRLADGDAAAAI